MQRNVTKQVYLPFVSNVLTWSASGIVRSCIRDNTLLGMAGFSLKYS